MRYARRIGAIINLYTLSAVAAAGIAQAHIVKQVGPYAVAIGWVREPSYVGEQNAVQVVIKDAHGKPVDDLTADDLKVVVSTGGKDSDPMAWSSPSTRTPALALPATTRRR